jgi:hypothetical protein
MSAASMFALIQWRCEEELLMEQLEQEFEERIRATITICRKLGYNPSQFEEIFNTYGGLKTAKRLVASGDLQYGLHRLAGLGRLDLSMEQIMLERGFAPLFTLEELQAARWRLAQIERDRG